MPPVAEFEPVTVGVATDYLVGSATPSPIKHLFGTYFIISSGYKWKLHQTHIMHKSNFWLTLTWSVLKIEKNFLYNKCLKKNILPESAEKTGVAV